MKAMSPKTKRITKIVVDVIFWLFFAFALCTTILAFSAQSSPTGYPEVGNKIMLTVQSDSMSGEDGFNEGDLIFINSFDTEEENADARKESISKLQIGDVITFRRDLNNDGVVELNTHRIISIETLVDGQYVFRTQGDNKDLPDTYSIYECDILGKWNGKRLAGAGAVIDFLKPPHFGFFALIILPLTGFFAYEVIILVIYVRKIKNKDKRVITEADEELIKQKAIEEFLKKQEAEKNNQK